MKAGTRKSRQLRAPAHQMGARQFGIALGGDMALDPRQQRSRRLGPVYDVYAGHALAVEDDAPGRREHPLGDANACFLGEFSNDAAG